MTPTPDQLRAAREWLDTFYRQKRMRNPHVADIAALLTAREAEAYKRGWEACREKAANTTPPVPTLSGNTADNPMESQGRGFYIGVRAVHAAIRALEPPSGEGE